MDGGVLTIHEDYFLLTGGIERWLYRVARKHAGHQEQGWRFTMRQLYAKSGANSRFSDFAIDIRKVIEADSLPEYGLEVWKNEEGEEVVSFIRRNLLAFDDPRYEGSRPIPEAGGKRDNSEIDQGQRVSRQWARSIRAQPSSRRRRDSTAYSAQARLRMGVIAASWP